MFVAVFCVEICVVFCVVLGLLCVVFCVVFENLEKSMLCSGHCELGKWGCPRRSARVLVQ